MALAYLLHTSGDSNQILIQLSRGMQPNEHWDEKPRRGTDILIVNEGVLAISSNGLSTSHMPYLTRIFPSAPKYRYMSLQTHSIHPWLTGSTFESLSYIDADTYIKVFLVLI